MFNKLFTNKLYLKKYRFVRLSSSLNLWNEELTPVIKHKIEAHWKGKLFNQKYDPSDKQREKYYVLSMFPYPSGFLHMGHVRVYTISDAIARFQRMNGKNVFHPIGWDAFGLPAENAAIERDIPPADWTWSNIRHMKEQLRQLACSFDWDREIATCDPRYYRWTQELFLKMYDDGLVYQKEALVNWDPIDQTVLADEQVNEDGFSWRSGAKVVKKRLKQWFIRTTKYATQLVEGLNDEVLHDWRDIIDMQRNWIGDCNGVNFDFLLEENGKIIDTLKFWTDLPEYVENVKFLAVSKQHLLANYDGERLGNAKKLFVFLINPFNGQKIPIYVSEDIEYLPSTDSFLGIPGIEPIAQQFAEKYFINYEILTKYSNIESKRHDICAKAKALNVGGYWTSAKLRDWLISRQRYWGTPIPIVHCNNCGCQPVPRDQLPITLPNLNKSMGKTGSFLSECTDWFNTNCPKCGGNAKRETDTMDTFMDSSWYYLRYLDPENTKEIFDKTKTDHMLPVDLYIGGKEHAVLHLYYARFVSHFLHHLHLVPEKEPFKRLLVQGMVNGQTFKLKSTGEYLRKDQVEILDEKKNKAVVKETNEPVDISWEKMSKSKYNGVDPNEMFNTYGIDTTRLLILADVAPTSSRNWNSKTFPGIINWQKRLWLIVRNFIKHRTDNLPEIMNKNDLMAHDDFMYDSRNYYIKGTTFNYCISQQHSIAISKQQGLTNSLRKVPGYVHAHSLQFERALASQLIMLAPMAPHFASELWAGFRSAPNRLNTNIDEIDWNKSVLEQKWPQIDREYNMNLICEVNGEKVCVVKIPKYQIEELREDEAVNMALEQDNVQKEIDARNVIRTNYKIYQDYDGTVSIKTDQIVKMKKKMKK